MNEIKQIYKTKQRHLQDLKQKVTNAENVDGVIDQSVRSKARIQLESLLIDMNEEVFAISEEMSRLFSLENQSNLNTSSVVPENRVKEFQKRSNFILSKMSEAEQSNTVIQYLKSQDQEQRSGRSPTQNQ